MIVLQETIFLSREEWISGAQAKNRRAPGDENAGNYPEGIIHTPNPSLARNV